MKILSLFLACAFILLLLSCKKKYTCDCETAYTFKNSSNTNYGTIIIPASKAPYVEKMKLSQAKAACVHEQTAIQTDFTNGITNNGQYSLVKGESIITSCAIKL